MVPRTLVAFPSTAIFGQQAALAFHEEGKLEAYLTSFAHLDAGLLARALRAVPGGDAINRNLRRRAVTVLPPASVRTMPFWEVVRTVADKAGAGVVAVDRIWDHLSRRFAREAGRRLVRDGIGAVYAYEYSALEAFQAARKAGAANILDFPSLNSRQFEELQNREKQRYPELVGPNDPYFAGLFETRQARRDAEMNLADVIITNSSVTRASHVRGGADPAKTFAVPYGAPPPIDRIHPRPVQGPLRVVWAGTFSIRKGAHLFVEAWRRMAKLHEAVVDVYGAVPLPDRLWKPAPPGIEFHGSVVRPVLFEALESADVLLFPSLSDGFGMVVTEAFARGLPVITTDQAGASDLVRHQRNGLIIQAGDASAIFSGLEWCCQNRERLAEMRFEALQTARDWQWSDYRRALLQAVSTGLQRTGFVPPATGTTVGAAFAQH